MHVNYKDAIQVEDLGTIYITGGGYVRYPFKGIARDSKMGWEEPVWGGDLTRSTDFVLSNIEDVDFGLVARCEISFKYLNANDFIALRNIAKQRVCYVDYFNADLGQRVSQEMAFTDTEIGKIYNYGEMFYGKRDVSVKLVATNRDKVGLINSTYTISYNSNGGSGSASNQTAKFSDNIQLIDGSAFTRSGYSLAGFNTKADGTGWAYLPNQRITVFKDLELYAMWK